MRVPHLSDDLRNWIVVAGVALSAGSILFAARGYLRSAEVERDRWRVHLSVQMTAREPRTVPADAAAPERAPEHEAVHAEGAVQPAPPPPPAPPASPPSVAAASPSAAASPAAPAPPAEGSATAATADAPAAAAAPAGEPAGPDAAAITLVSLGGAKEPEAPAAAAEPPAPRPPPPPRRVEAIHLLVRNSSHRPAALVKLSLRDATGKEFGERELAERLRLPAAVDPWRVVHLEVALEPAELRRAEKLVARDVDDHELALPLHDQAAYRKWFDFP